IDELVRLASVAARHGSPYVSHLRNETDRVMNATEEAIAIGRRSGATVHVSHHKAAGRRNWGATAQTLERIDLARREGLEMTLDVYPYTAGSTALQALLPPWALEGGTDAMLERLAHSDVRRRIS